MAGFQFALFVLVLGVLGMTARVLAFPVGHANGTVPVSTVPDEKGSPTAGLYAPPEYEGDGFPNWPWRRSWAQFCDDDDCVHCGMAVDMHNPGCLAQPITRRSIKIHGARAPIDGQSLVVSPAQGGYCGCQAACEQVPTRGPAVSVNHTRFRGPDKSYDDVEYCWRLSYYSWLGQETQWSFMFTEKKCERDGCDWKGSRIVGSDTPFPTINPDETLQDRLWW